MIKISVYGNIENVDSSVIWDGEYPGDFEDLKTALDQMFCGKFGEWQIIGEFEDNRIKVNEFYKYDFKFGEFVKRSFEELYLDQTGGWFGMDIDRVFKF
ncbi:MAG: hypothetical protein J1F35_08190 [Erysipelotrichales bacterium]|nr:hypothetical protein [Erysipelotrichales bacterium]